MKEFLRFVIGGLVDHPEGVILHEEERDSTLKFLLELPRAEVGKVIGKQGHTIHAIRNLLANAAARHHQRATLEIDERAA